MAGEGQRDLGRDAVINVIHGGIKHDIRVVLDNECLRAAVILTYAGMDSMAYLGMPGGQKQATREDFVAWAEQYVRFPGHEQLSGWDLYGARCGMLHAYGVVSSLSEQGKCRKVGYMDTSQPPIRYDPEVSETFVLVSVPALVDAFFVGVDRFLVEAFADPDRAEIVESRFDGLVHVLPYVSPGKRE